MPRQQGSADPKPRTHTVCAEDVEAAERTLSGVARTTPVQLCDRLTDQVGVPVYLKREDLQVCRSFKVRGAYVRMRALTPEQRRAGVVCASAGNHAQGVARACALLHVRGAIYLPQNTPWQKRRRIAAIGGSWVEQIIVDGTFDRANGIARHAAQASGRTFVPAYDDPQVVAGQGTIAVEVAEQMPGDLDTVFVPVGGGGLLAGIAAWFAERRPEVRVVGVEPAGAASMRAALEAGHPVTLPSIDPFVDGTAVGRAGDLTYELVRDCAHDVVVVPEGRVCSEMLDLYQTEGIVAEPAGALAGAALRAPLSHPPEGPVVAVVSGGNNDVSRYAEVQDRSLRFEGLRHYFLMTFPQQPGALRSFVLDVLGPQDDIVHFEYTRKSNRETGPALVGIDLRDRADFEPLLRRLSDSTIHAEEIRPGSELFRLLF